MAQVVPFTGKEGTNYWAGEDHNAIGTAFTTSGAEGAATNSPNNELQILWSGINIAGKTGLSFRGLLAANSTNEPWDNTQACISGVGTTNTDYIIVQYSIDGGPFINLVRFFNRGSASGTSDKYLYEDTNNDGCGDVGGLQLTNAFKEITKTIIGTGSTMSLKILIFSEGNNEEWAIDNFRLFETTSIPVVLNCPTNTTVASCQSQAAVNAAFTTWLATASASGGCSGVLTNNNVGAPSACGGSTTVTFTYTSTCAPFSTTCQSTFTVAGPQPLTITCPTPTTVASCQTQAAINLQFANWLGTINGQGGCNPFVTDNSTAAPAACGGSKTVTFTIYSSCAPFQANCSSTFTVTPSPPILLTCPTNTTVAFCQTQAAVNAAFTAWLASATASGGCNGVLTNNNTGAPSACGGSTTVTFTYTSTCAPLTTTCQATFTVAAAPPVIPTCPTNFIANGGQSQSAINMQFASWLATASGTGGCNGVLTNNNTGAPPATGGSTTVTFTFTSSCAPITTTCQATFSVQQSNFYNTATNTYFATLQDAINAANGMTPDTIELLDNMSEANITVTNSVVIRANGFTLTIPSGTLLIPMGKSLTWVENNLIINTGAMIDNDGTLTNTGTINYQGGMGMFNNTGIYSGEGSFMGNMSNAGTVKPGN